MYYGTREEEFLVDFFLKKKKKKEEHISCFSIAQIHPLIDNKIIHQAYTHSVDFSSKFQFVYHY